MIEYCTTHMCVCVCAVQCTVHTADNCYQQYHKKYQQSAKFKTGQ